MDFVIVGIMIGAVLVGAGALLRDLGPRLRPRISRPDTGQIEPERLTFAWTRFCHSLGMAITTLGFLIVLATVFAFFIEVGSGVGWAIVAVMTFLALAGSVASTVIISGHYRRGGFDPRDRSMPDPESDARPIAPPTLIIDDETVAIATDDPFESINPITPISVTEEVVVVAPESEIAAEATLSSETAANEAEPEPAQRVVELDRDEPALDQVAEDWSPELETSRDDSVEAEPDVAAGLVEPDSAPAYAIYEPVEHWQLPVSQWEPPAVPVAADDVPVLSGFEPPLIDPDDELPAWGSPPPLERIPPTPVQYVPTSGVGEVFESSLLADLRPDSLPSEGLAGPFQSRLLNELTRSDEQPEPAGNDVLIAETPAAGKRGRGSRSG